MDNRCVIGIDLGTSSAKVLCRYENGESLRVRESYGENTPQGWLGGVKKALKKITREIEITEGCVCGIGLTGQVGTYIIETGEKTHITMWTDNRDGSCLEKLLGKFTTEEFLSEISMPHPNLISYPAPKLLEFNEKYNNINIRRIYQPKDFLCGALAGKMATDKYSWRGLANSDSGRYSEKLLGFTGIDAAKLPPVIGILDACGTIIPELANELGLPLNVPVFTGCNDFFAALLGIGVWDCGDAFDITGTSEHIGVISEDINTDKKLVCGGYFNKNAVYGVTSSSGAALRWALDMFGGGGGESAEDIGEILRSEPPVFLPYVNGEERAPVFDPDARGVFFGVNDKSNNAGLRYSVLEGVCFSLFNIRENIDCDIECLTVAGGAAENKTLNAIKSELFNVPVNISEETEASALGAAMFASVGAGWHESLYDAARQMSGRKNIAVPAGKYRNILLQRYEIFKRLYPVLKEDFKRFQKIWRNT